MALSKETKDNKSMLHPSHLLEIKNKFPSLSCERNKSKKPYTLFRMFRNGKYEMCTGKFRLTGVLANFELDTFSAKEWKQNRFLRKSEMEIIQLMYIYLIY